MIEGRETGDEGRGWSLPSPPAGSSLGEPHRPRGGGSTTSWSSDCPRPGPGLLSKVARKPGLRGQVCSRLEIPAPLLLGGPQGWEENQEEREGNSIDRSHIFILKGGLTEKKHWPLKEGGGAHLKRSGRDKPVCPDGAHVLVSKANLSPSRPPCPSSPAVTDAHVTRLERTIIKPWP